MKPIASPQEGWAARGRGEGGQGRGRARPDRFFCSKTPYLSQIGFFCSQKRLLKQFQAPNPTRRGGGRGRAGFLLNIGFFLLKKTLSGPDRVFLLQNPSLGLDRVREANSKPQTQPGGSGVAGRGEGGQGRGRASFLLKKTLSGPDRVFLLKKALSGPDRVFFAPKNPIWGPARVFKAQKRQPYPIPSPKSLNPTQNTKTLAEKLVESKPGTQNPKT